MAQQLLHRADVLTTLQQMGRKAVAQRMRRSKLDDPSRLHCPLEAPLDALLVDMVTANCARAWIDR
ncbi:hypothetical protein D3C78_1304840 [compost metagenome]